MVSQEIKTAFEEINKQFQDIETQVKGAREDHRLSIESLELELAHVRSKLDGLRHLIFAETQKQQ